VSRKGIAPPEYLYRGDEDKANTRKLRQTISERRFLANRINAGEGRIIFENPLMIGIEKYLGRTLRDAVFLSFTEDLGVAYAYGASNLHLKRQEIEHDFWEYGGDEADWDFLIMTLHSHSVPWNPVGKGFFEGYYPVEGLAGLKRVILVDVETALKDWRKHDENYAKSYAAARRDREWLLFREKQLPIREGGSDATVILEGATLTLNTMMRKSSTRFRALSETAAKLSSGTHPASG
jgi:hypothetical protein